MKDFINIFFHRKGKNTMKRIRKGITIRTKKGTVFDTITITKDNDDIDGIHYTHDNYMCYRMVDELNLIAGRMSFEKYNGTWHLESMEVRPMNKGYGTYFLKEVLKREGLDPSKMTTDCVHDKALPFLHRFRFNILARDPKFVEIKFIDPVPSEKD